jgi:hypothetical protein
MGKTGMKPKEKKLLGILALDENNVSPPPPADTFNFPDWFPYAVLERKVPGALPREVVGGNLALAEAYAQTARELEKEGVTAITADCGYTVAYQEAVRDAVSVPVACSSLLQLPLILTMLPRQGKIGLLTFDSSRLTDHHLRCAGIDPDAVPMSVLGVEGTQLWKNWIGDPVTTDWKDFDREVLSAARRLVRRDPGITHILLECAGFPRCAPQIRKESGRPVFDWVSLCNHLMEAAVPSG